MGKATGNNVRLGLFVIAGTALLLLAAYLIGNEQKIFSRTFEISTVFKNVGGLQEGNNVRYSGINVGTVREIRMENDTSIRVYMRIESEMQRHIKGDAVALVGSDGLVGSMLVNILPGEGQGPPVTEGMEIPSFSRITTQDMLSTLNVTNENAAQLTADLLAVTHSLKNGSGVLGQLLNDSILAGDFRESLANLKRTTARSAAMFARLEDLIAGWDTDESAAGLLFDNPDFAARLQQTAARLDSTGQELHRFARRLNSMTDATAEGQGVAGVLLKDTVSARHLQSTLISLDSAMIKFDQNMEAMKHNFLTRRYFRKLERQEKKE
ncbi:MlaD family protein [Robiginitalea sp. SC105]|uniref:MlaD family protein n=1 Tax=Robiginitalea sp. SC105 TaxID=2762332 RepID=UPI0016398CCC|nr:MlaD family protein [Robiginitalea sp. SC105]MBC2839551.1 MCE family protein [Robiginitalea sp. SC105]